MKIAVGTDHRGVDALSHIVNALEHKGLAVSRLGVCDEGICDYPDTAYPVASAVAAGQVDRGILICGSGIGMSIAANKVKGVRAALVHDEIGAELSRSHNDANVLCLPADLLGMRLMLRIVDTWVATEFAGGRHARRISKIAAIEDGRHPNDTDRPAKLLG